MWASQGVAVHNGATLTAGFSATATAGQKDSLGFVHLKGTISARAAPPHSPLPVGYSPGDDSCSRRARRSNTRATPERPAHHRSRDRHSFRRWRRGDQRPVSTRSCSRPASPGRNQRRARAARGLPGGRGCLCSGFFRCPTASPSCWSPWRSPRARSPRLRRRRRDRVDDDRRAPALDHDRRRPTPTDRMRRGAAGRPQGQSGPPAVATVGTLASGQGAPGGGQTTGGGRRRRRRRRSGFEPSADAVSRITVRTPARTPPTRPRGRAAAAPTQSPRRAAPAASRDNSPACTTGGGAGSGGGDQTPPPDSGGCSPSSPACKQ